MENREVLKHNASFLGNFFMRCASLSVFALIVASSVLISSADADPSTQWYLMSRHGECAAICALQRKVPDMGEIDDPQSFVRLMKGRGYKVIADEPAELQGQAVQVDVPQLELGLMFVKGLLCKEFMGR